MFEIVKWNIFNDFTKLQQLHVNFNISAKINTYLNIITNYFMNSLFKLSRTNKSLYIIINCIITIVLRTINYICVIIILSTFSLFLLYTYMHNIIL